MRSWVSQPELGIPAWAGKPSLSYFCMHNANSKNIFKKSGFGSHVLSKCLHVVCENTGITKYKKRKKKHWLCDPSNQQKILQSQAFTIRTLLEAAASRLRFHPNTDTSNDSYICFESCLQAHTYNTIYLIFVQKEYDQDRYFFFSLCSPASSMASTQSFVELKPLWPFCHSSASFPCCWISHM